MQPLAALDHVGEEEHPARIVVDRDADHLRVEDLAHPVADEVIDRLRVELPGDRGLDAVDQRQLGVPLPGLLDEARVLERGADAAGERDEQPLVGVAERVLAVDVLQRDDAEDGRRSRAARRAPTSAPLRRSPPGCRRTRPPPRILVDQERLTGLEHVLPEPDQRHRLDLEALAALDA